MNKNIQILLVSPTHPGNIGAAARAMKTMGLSQLVIVNPPSDFPSQTATAMAAGADDIMQQAQMCSNLDTALADSQLIIGTSARLRHLPVELLNPEGCAEKTWQTASTGKVTLMFGREHAGLTNEELNRCHYHVHIPSVADFSSLNLAASVQVICYALRQRYLALTDTAPDLSIERELATDNQVQRYYQKLEQLLTNINFIKNSSPKKIMHRLQRMFNRIHIEKEEIDLLLGIINKIEQTQTND